MDNNKYDFTDDSIVICGHRLHRIVAKRKIGYVEAGQLGGYIELPSNLDSEGDCWVGQEAKVYGYLATVQDDALVFGNAVVHGATKVMDQAMICDDSHVNGYAGMGKISVVGGCSVICGDAHLFGDFNVVDEVIISK